MRMPTLRSFGEEPHVWGSSRPRTLAIRRGSGLGTSERWFEPSEGRPVTGENGDLSIASGGGHGGSLDGAIGAFMPANAGRRQGPRLLRAFDRW